MHVNATTIQYEWQLCMDEVKISVALCTCNGERYLQEQLQSLAKQEHAPFELVVSDDASTDSTCRILDDFAAGSPFTVRVQRNSESLGVIKNFERVLSLCNGDYIALCDQDDVWLPDKLVRLAKLVRACESKNGGGPTLVYSDMELVDADLKRTGRSYAEDQRLEVPKEQSYRTLLVQNYIPGCTMLFSADLLTSALPFPDDTAMHDWWLALLAALSGSVCQDPSRSVLYRQHSDNQVGSAPRLSVKNALSVVALLPALRTIQGNYSVAAAQARAAVSRLSDRGISVPKDARDFVASLSGPRFRTLAAVLAGKVSRANLLRNIALMIAVLTVSRA
jgi:glycosyltransferase involved in cell wall biosynthesis